MDTRQQTNIEVSSDEYYTPRWIIDQLGPFDLDPCSPEQRPWDTAKIHLTKQQDGLLYDWVGRVWLNPPYSKKLLTSFVGKLADHNNGIALLINRTDNLLFQEVIFPKAASMLFMRNRVKFVNPDGTSKDPKYGSVLIAFGKENDEILKHSGIEGKYIQLNNASMSYAEFTASLSRLDEKKRMLQENIEKEIKSLRNAYMESNKTIPVGSKVKVTTYDRKGNIKEEKTGVLTDYWQYLDGELHYEISFPVRKKRLYEVESTKYKVEIIEEV